MKKFIITLLVVGVFTFLKDANAQSKHSYYNVDSLLGVISKNAFIKQTLLQADDIYTSAGITEENISKKAFRVGYLEKVFLDSGRLDIISLKLYEKRNLLTIVDFTKKGNENRFITIDLQKRQILHSSIVAQGSAICKKKECKQNSGELFGLHNNKFEAPQYFGNIDSSSRSSLGLILTQKGFNPGNPCHFCKDILDKPHSCSMRLTGLDTGVNDLVNKRDIVIHTTGSKDFSDSISTALLTKKIKKSYAGYTIKDCNCINPQSTATPAYASKEIIQKDSGFIGQSLGCLVLPEDNHIEIIKTIKGGSLIFCYSHIIGPTSTNYFLESPIIKKIIEFSALD